MFFKTFGPFIDRTAEGLDRKQKGVREKGNDMQQRAAGWNRISVTVSAHGVSALPTELQGRPQKPKCFLQQVFTLMLSSKTFFRFFTYGDLPLEQHLKQIEEEALSKFERISPNTEVPSQPHWSSPVSSNYRLQREVFLLILSEESSNTSAR